MTNKIIAIGPTTQNNTELNGQSMMFQLLIDEVISKKIKLIIVDIGKSVFKKYEKRVSGKFSIFKLINYIIILAKFFLILLFNPKQTVYLTTAQSKVGFIRDYFIINLARLFGSKIIAHQFGANYTGFYNSQSDFFKKLITKTLIKTDRIVVEGDYTKRQFDFLPGYLTKVYSLPNGLPEKVDSSKIKAKIIDNKKPVKLFYLSNLIESKGYWDVLEAINILVNNYKIEINAVFSGKFLDSVDDIKFKNGAEGRKAFFEFIEKNNLKENIIYFEGLYGKRKSEEFLNSHFFLLPSYYINEGQPVSVLEALAYGCVPIVTEYRLIPTMVNKENGFFVNPKSPNEIADIIKELSNNREKYTRYSQASIDYYLNNFTTEKYTNHLISLF